MKIERKGKNFSEFENIQYGEVFIHDDEFYLKLSEIMYDDSKEEYNAIDLFDGTCHYFDSYETCLAVEAVVHIKE